jgi:hypothetical protein
MKKWKPKHKVVRAEPANKPRRELTSEQLASVIGGDLDSGVNETHVNN